jgi:K+-sensing histidine kinase KdpD
VVTVLPTTPPSEQESSEQEAWDRRMAIASTVAPVVVFVIAVAAPVALALALLPFRSEAPAAAVALGFAVLVSLLGAVGTRLTALVAAVSAAACYNVAFTQPYGSFAISHPQDIETTALLLVGGLIVGQLSARNRRNRALVVQQGADLARIQSIAELMAAGAPAGEVVDAVAEELRSVLRLRDCHFETSQPEKPGPTIDRNGDVSWGRIWWGVDTLGLPGKEITIEVEHDHRRLGRFVLIARPGTKVRRDQLLAAVTLADQAGAALGGGTPPLALAHR